MAQALPVGAESDFIVHHALGSSADILTKGWNIDQYCQDPEWKEVMVLWKDRQLHAVVREVDEDRLDAENSPFLKLSLEEARQAVRDALEARETVAEDPQEPEDSEQRRVQQRETALKNLKEPREGERD
jgi:hypothetical protein